VLSLDPTCIYICTRGGFPTLFSSTDDGPKPPPPLTNMAMKPLLNIGSSESDRGTQFPFIAKLDCNFRPIQWGRVGTIGEGGEYFTSRFIQGQPHHHEHYTKTDSQADSEGEWTGPKFPNSWNHKCFGDHNRITHLMRCKIHVPRNTLMNEFKDRETRGTRRKASSG
jgi:hypothetical protein